MSDHHAGREVSEKLSDRCTCGAARAELIARLEAAGADDGSTLDRLSYEIGKFLGEERPWRAYTTSVDAALTLVPRDRDWMIRRIGGKGFAVIGGSAPSGSVVTPALAICIAALKAREAAE